MIGLLHSSLEILYTPLDEEGHCIGLYIAAWFISNFQKTLKWLVLALPKSYSIFNKTVRCTKEFCVLGVGHSCL